MSDTRAALVLLTCLVAAGCRATSGPPAAAVTTDTWATVNGKSIMRDDVEKAYRRTRDASQTPSDEEVLTAKLGLLNDLILQEVLLEKGAALKLDAAQAEIDTAYNDAKKNIPDEAFQKELKQRNLTPADMRDSVRREVIAQKVLKQEVELKVTVSDQDITDYFNANRAQFNVAEESYRIAQIVVTPVRDPQITNSTGDDATTPQAAAAKVQTLMDRLKAGASFHDLAAAYSEDPESAPRGGDLGFVPVSKLRQLPPQLRDSVLNKTPGTVNIVGDGNAHTLVLVVAHEPAGQRDLSTPGMRDNISATIRSHREQLLRAAYINAVRSDAAVVNYAARRLVEANGKMPSLPLSAPGKK